MHSPNIGHAQLPNGAIVEIYFSRTFCLSTYKVCSEGGFYCKTFMVLVLSYKTALNLYHNCLDIFLFIIYLSIGTGKYLFV
jgi:hypothetical protein